MMNFFKKIIKNQDFIDFLDSCFQSFPTLEMTEKCLNIWRILSKDESFREQISMSKAYLKSLTRFCTLWYLAEEKHKDFALILMRILIKVFKKHLIESFVDIAEAVRVLAKYDWAMVTLFEENIE